jgi:uncharacterized protein YebE (UPF0316 family)
METSFFNSNTFGLIVLPVMIFFARICDVSIGTMRIIFVSKGKKNIAPLLGFFEVLIWIIVISKIMQNLNNYINYIAYAAGFATGNLVGMIIEEKLAVGVQMIRVFTYQRGSELLQVLNQNGYGATSVEAANWRNSTRAIDNPYCSSILRCTKEDVIEQMISLSSEERYTTTKGLVNSLSEETKSLQPECLLI